MVPWWLIRKGAQWAADKAEDAADAKEKLNKANQQPADSPMPDDEDDTEVSSTDVEIGDGAQMRTARRRRSRKLTPIRGGGFGSFLELGDESMQFWADALTTVHGYRNPDKPASSTIADSNKDDDFPANAPQPEDDDDSDESGTSLWDVVKVLGIFVVPALVAWVARYGVKIVEKDGKKIIETTKWQEFLKEHALPKYDNATYADGNILERSGLGDFQIFSKYNEVRDYGAGTHKAIDIAAPIGTPIQAPFDGYINYVDKVDDSKAGKYVEIATPDGRHIFRYLHLDSVLVRKGDQVRRGQVIAKSGNTYGGATRPNGTPWSSGPHVHLEYRQSANKIPVGTSAYNLPLENPLAYGAELPQTVDYAGGNDVKVTFSKNTTIGTEGKNLMSVRNDGKSEWLGTTGFNQNRAGSFASFDTYEHALRAGMISLLKYQTVHDVSDTGGEYTTINDIARNNKKHSYVDPRNGDRVDDWIQNVSAHSGFAPDEPIDLRRRDHLAKLSQGISMAEHSARPDYDDVVKVIRRYNITNDLISNTQPL